jgi:hypothetical protein
LSASSPPRATVVVAGDRTAGAPTSDRQVHCGQDADPQERPI